MRRTKLLVYALLASCAWGQATITGTPSIQGTVTITSGTAGLPGPNDVYLAPAAQGGSDSNPCTLTQPCLTPQHASSVVRGMPGGKHVVWFRGGTYYLTSAWSLNSADSGSATTPILYQNFPNETPVISGGVAVPATSWTQAGSCGTGTKYTASYTTATFADTEALFYNGERRYRPRSSATYLTQAGSCFATSQGSSCTQLTSPINGCAVGQFTCFDRFNLNSAGDANPSWHGLAKGDIIVDDFEQWTKSTLRVQSISGTLVTLTGATFNDSQDSGFLKDHRLIFENVLESLGPGQWYLDRSTPNINTTNRTLNYCAAPGEDPTNTANVVEIPQQAKIITAAGLHDVSFRGLTFAHDNWTIPSAGLGDQQGMPNVPAAMSFVNTTNVVLDGVTARNIQGWAVEFIGDGTGASTFSAGVCTGNGSCGNSVVRSRFYDIGADPIRIGRWPCVGNHQQVTDCRVADTENSVSQHNTVQDNLMAYTGQIQPTVAAGGTWIGNSHHNLVTHNEVHHIYDTAFSVGFNYGYENQDGSLKCASVNAAPRCLAHDNEISYNWGYQSGRGVMQDVVGGAYFAAGNTTGNTALHNKFTDAIAGWHDLHGYGGDLIYMDQGSTNVTAKFNLLARATGACFNLNPSERKNDIFPQNNVFENNILVDCGSSTSNNVNTDPAVFRRDGSNPNAVTFRNNVVSVDLGHESFMAHKGGWFPNGNATGQFEFDHNLWWNRASGNRLSGDFITCKTSACSPFSADFNLLSGAANFDTSTWNTSTRTNAGDAATGEDFGSISADPQFRMNTADDYVPAVTPSGFVPFEPGDAGRITNFMTVPTLPDAWPPFLLDPNKDWGTPIPINH
ncbi:MAG: hypothetical protein LAN83_19395 [Acidobacteriia bacterium]|nr:hypothetical protein [Terriglobia bacterium]